MDSRISYVEQLDNVFTDALSIIEIGDAVSFFPDSYTLVLIRQRAVFYANEIHFNDYTVFSRPFDHPVITENVAISKTNEITDNELPVIKVSKMNIFALLGSSLLQVGSNQTINAKTRLKTINNVFQNGQPSGTTVEEES